MYIFHNLKTQYNKHRQTSKATFANGNGQSTQLP